jgi:hypothetical protein
LQWQGLQQFVTKNKREESGGDGDGVHLIHEEKMVGR